jgi:hypothetical protein
MPNVVSRAAPRERTRIYLGAIKTLAQVRRLQVPATAQLNVAERQVNIATQPASAPIPPPAELPE